MVEDVKYDNLLGDFEPRQEKTEFVFNSTESGSGQTVASHVVWVEGTFVGDRLEMSTL